MANQWLLILMIFGYSDKVETPTVMSMTAASGFLTYNACTQTGEAWKKTKHELDRDYECIPASEK